MQALSPRSSLKFSISKLPRLVRRGLLWIFLPLAACFALPSLLMAALLWWRASKTWDAQERWSGTWLVAVVCGGIYGGILWFGHPLPSLLQTIVFGVFDHALSRSVVSLERLWGLHLLLIPACALILEGLHPLSRRVRLKPRYSIPPSREHTPATQPFPPPALPAVTPPPA